MLKVFCPLAVYTGRIIIADADGNCLYLKLLNRESKITKGLQDLLNVAGDLDAQIQQCNIKRFPWVCVLMCHKAGINQSFLIHKSFSLKYSFLREQHRLLRSRSFAHSRRFLSNQWLNPWGEICLICLIVFFTQHINRHGSHSFVCYHLYFLMAWFSCSL